MEILYILLVVLVLARFFGEIAKRMGLPALMGELIAGIMLGLLVHPFEEIFPILSTLPENEVFVALADLGVFFLMLLAGLELQPRQLLNASASASLVAGVGVAVPLVVGVALGWFYIPASEYKLAQALFLGTAMSITAVPVAAKVLMDLGQMNSRAGRTIISAAVVDDILGLMLLAVLTAILKTGEPPSGFRLLALGGQIILFFALASAVAHYAFNLIGAALKHVRLEEFEVSALLIVALGLSLLAEVLGLHFILGAFIAGLFFIRPRVGTEAFRDVEQKVSAFTQAFFAPIFFVSIGLHLEWGALTAVPGFVIVFILISILVKMSAGLPAYWLGLGVRESAAVGIGMSARGAVELVIADIALRAGLFAVPEPPPLIITHLFSSVVLMAIVTTLLPPLLLQRLLGTGQTRR